ncbi:immunoglobulin-like domain-containing protein [Sporosarcina sp. FSL K6-1508]|uniref:immunoglobulin-like domain-containing protein n=1 Tax=Sporosarcina sp. FSL K6-1508 TaxID=2921553 RepID=UPI0030F55F41
MKKMLSIAIVLLLFLSACGNEPAVSTLPDPVPDQEMFSSEEGLSLVLDEDSFIGSPPIIKTLVQNYSSSDYQLGDFYHIEVNKDGQWHIITYSDAVFLKNPSFKDYGNVLSAGSEARQTFSVDALGVTLIPGEYRLVKSFISTDEQMHELSVAVPFSVK